MFTFYSGAAYYDTGMGVVCSSSKSNNVLLSAQKEFVDVGLVLNEREFSL